MSSRNIAALHDRIDEDHFEVRLHASAIDALQQRVNLLEAAIRELRLEAFGDAASLPTSTKSNRVDVPAVAVPRVSYELWWSAGSGGNGAMPALSGKRGCWSGTA